MASRGERPYISPQRGHLFVYLYDETVAWAHATWSWGATRRDEDVTPAFIADLKRVRSADAPEEQEADGGFKD